MTNSHFLLNKILIKKCFLLGDSLRADIFRGRPNNNAYEPIALNDLDLSGNKVTELSANVFEHCPQITRLSLSENKLKVLTTSTLRALTSLRQLEVSKAFA